MKLIKVSEDKFIIVEGGNILYSTYPIDYSEQILLSEVKELVFGMGDKYTKDDIKRAFDEGYHIRDFYGDRSDNMTGDDYVKSLNPKSEWDVEFINGKLKLK